ncbi:histidine--tRNA ligase [Ferruginibacter albus]|uniref:histidine--tRNA ligase n=1 Tax=Ferruginibacter albus TaxID=2875540 RepID=UPI001CC3A38E|nr:histidine--tRNA ligase [Ferruginibacter albus]UAY51590.1 histidine--tRNA ligase [Ferruginibacter albus]
MSKPSIPKGTRDLSADIVRKRNFIFTTIKTVFEKYGFEPLETPAMENLETLMGKYGEEGDRLIYKILNNGLTDPKNIDKAKAGFEKVMQGKSSADLTERALKYDLTIPFARYVAMNHNTLTFPYRRYQIQPVWRGDNPQKGRYREFTQCDADVVGSKSLLSETELSAIYHEVFTLLGIAHYELRINNRKILAALAEKVNASEKLTDITIAIDKLDKIGIEKVKEELAERQIATDQIAIIEKYLLITGNNEEKLSAITSLLSDTDTGKQGIEELQFIVSAVQQYLPTANILVDFTLARGLNYYTGTIFEAKAPATVKIGSIGGGGRYDDLTGLFGVPGIPGVGISFGVDRIYDVMEELNLFPQDLSISTQALFFNMGDAESKFAFGAMQLLRSKGIACELYHEFTKINKQFTYAEKKKIPFVIIIGSKEIEQNNCLVKNLTTGVQETVELNKLDNYFKK